MSGPSIGADPEALDEVARAIRALAGQLVVPPGWRSDRLLNLWVGPDADQVLAVLHRAEHDRRRCGEALLRSAGVLARAAVEQRRASSSAPVSVVESDRPGDGGRLVQRIGSSAATVVVLLVPGVGTDRGDRSRLRADAARVWGALADRTDDPDDCAVVSWLGYDPPDGLLGALDLGPAEEGAAALVADVGSLRRRGARTVVVVGHSYGGVVVGRAAVDGMDADGIVQLGSPGSGEPGATAAIRARGVDLHAVRETGDPIGFVSGRLPGRYGEDPVGSVETLPTSRSGHSAYLADAALLGALAELVLGYRRTP